MTESRQILDCFTFAGELDLLEFRLQLLATVVDRFVVVEATRTHSGTAKPLAYDAHRERFAKYGAMIDYVVVNDLPPPSPDRWAPEKFQRNAIQRGLTLAGPSDLVLVSDVDEIPDPEVVARLREVPLSTARLDLRPCYYRANWESSGRWPLARVGRLDQFSSPQQLRESTPPLTITEAGAHFSYLMDARRIAQKLSAFAHSELDTERGKRLEYLRLTIAAGVFAPGNDLLDCRGEMELGRVQQELLKRRPELFSFVRFPPVLIRRAVRKYARLRLNPRVPDSAVRLADRIGCGLLADASRRSS